MALTPEEKRMRHAVRSRALRAKAGQVTREEYRASVAGTESDEERRARQNGYAREWRARNREKRAAASSAWNKANPRSRLATQLKRYAMTVEQYDSMLESQLGGCKICGGPPIRNRLAVDHCHETGRVRGLLCDRCNTRLATIEDEAWVHKARAYLEGR